MPDLDERARLVRRIVERTGGRVRDRDEWLMCVEIPGHCVNQLAAFAPILVGRTGNGRLVYDVDLRPARLRVVAR
jgi:hypothetical protein